MSPKTAPAQPSTSGTGTPPGFRPASPAAEEELLRLARQVLGEDQTPTPLAQTAVTAGTAPDPAPVPTFSQGAQLRPRVTVVEQVHYAGPAQPSSASVTRFETYLDSDEQPWVRGMPVPDVWTPLKNCWVEEAAVIVIEAVLPRYSVVPTPEQAAADRASVVYVGVAPDPAAASQRTMHSPPQPPVQPLLEVRPGEAARFRPAVPLSRLVLTCPTGRGFVNVTAFPA